MKKDNMQSDNTKTEYYISTGKQQKMYTLRRTYIEYGHGGYAYEKDTFICTLAHDLDKAIAKAKARLGKTSFHVTQTEVNDIADSRTIDHSLMPNGQFQSRPFTECSLPYLGWWWSEYAGRPTYVKTVELIEVYLIENDMLTKHEGQLITRENLAKIEAEKERKAKYEKMMEERKARPYFGEVGKKYTEKMTCVHQYGFDGSFGYCNVFTFTDGKHTFIYMGTLCEWTKNGEYEMSFTVKAHKSYKEQKQTYMARPKFVVLSEPEMS